MRSVVFFVLSVVVLSSGFAILGHTARAGPAQVTAPGALAAKFAGTSTVGVIELAVSNSAGSATGVYDQRVVLNSERFAGLVNINFTNVLATYASSGQPIPGWIESGASNASANTTLWLRLNSIPAAGTAFIALDCYPKSSFVLSESGMMGENPLLSSSYGQFDNGWRVFNFYDNFSGSVLNARWSLGGSWTTSVNNGVRVSAVPGNGANISSQQRFSFPAAVDFYGDTFQTSATTAFIVEGIGTSACPSCGTGNAAGWDAQGSASGPTPYSASGSSQNVGSSVFASPQYALFSTEEDAAANVAFQLNYTTVTSWSGLTPTSPQPVALALSGHPAGSLTNTQTTYWIRERSYPAIEPNVTMLPGPALSVVANPSTLAVGQSLELATTASGGSTPYRYSYAGLPPGCATANVASLSCVVSTPGQYLVAVTATDAAGLAGTSAVNVTVIPGSNSAPLSVSLVAIPATVSSGSTLALLATVDGGVGAYTFSYSGLPGGCVSVDRASFSCSPTGTGAFAALVHVTDSAHGSANASANVTVVAAGPTAASGSSALPAWELDALGGGIALAVVLGAVALVLALRRPRSG
ncbi:MAG: hypothetical protein L3K07_01095 [Thermoplasmata archaeon]|nr:hypothetical protein [Thermoplasmata archaeon]